VIASPMLSIAPVRKTLVVEATPERAFEVFTAGIDRWYGKHADGSEVVVGHVLVWEPARRFACTWEIDADWKQDARVSVTSEVEVSFHPEPQGRTRVELEHRRFERMERGEKMREEVERGWPAILELYSQAVAR
jgi:hypothetical protein